MALFALLGWLCRHALGFEVDGVLGDLFEEVVLRALHDALELRRRALLLFELLQLDVVFDLLLLHAAFRAGFWKRGVLFHFLDDVLVVDQDCLGEALLDFAELVFVVLRQNQLLGLLGLGFFAGLYRRTFLFGKFEEVGDGLFRAGDRLNLGNRRSEFNLVLAVGRLSWLGFLEVEIVLLAESHFHGLVIKMVALNVRTLSAGLGSGHDAFSDFGSECTLFSFGGIVRLGLFFGRGVLNGVLDECDLIAEDEVGVFLEYGFYAYESE